jgi:non-ribosomal peptide synthetase component F
VLAQFKNAHRHDAQASRITLACREEKDSTPSAIDGCRWLLVPDEHGGLSVCITFNRNVYCPTSLETYAQVLRRLIHASASDSYLNLTSSAICTPADILQLGQWNCTVKEPFDVSSAGELFRRIAANYADNVAVANGGDDGMSLTYQQLDRWSDALALWLVDNGFGGPEETIVGIWQTRDVMLVVSYIACLKAGCAYMVRSLLLIFTHIHAALSTATGNASARRSRANHA